MKKYKKIFLVFSLVSIFALASCSGNSMEFIPVSDSGIENMDSKTENGASSNQEGNIGTPEYSSPNYTIGEIDIESEETAVEKTVKMVYGSVVSLLCTSTSATSAGSGVLFAEDKELGLSYIVTCFHVIEGAQNFQATLSDQTSTYTAQLVGGNSDYDLAVLSIKATDLTYASFFSDSDKINLGSQVVCIGNPLGTLPGSVSSGVVSYVNREVAVNAYTERKLIQTDVAINSGNSGGALFNTSGALIGIVNAKYTSSGVEGLGFAIPINDVKMVVSSIMNTAQYDKTNNTWKCGYVVGDWELAFDLSDGYTGSFYNQQRVVYVSSTSSNSTTSGFTQLKQNDIVTGLTIDYSDTAKEDTNVSLSSASSALLAINSADLSLNDSLIFTINRNGSVINVTVVLVQYIYTI